MRCGNKKTRSLILADQERVRKIGGTTMTEKKHGKIKPSSYPQKRSYEPAEKRNSGRDIEFQKPPTRQVPPISPKQENK